MKMKRGGSILRVGCLACVLALACGACNERNEATPANPAVQTLVLPAAIFPEKAKPGSFVRIGYGWRATGPLGADCTVVVHLVNGEGKVILSDDHAPPISTASAPWRGEIRYERTMDLPADLADGPCRIMIALQPSANDKATASNDGAAIGAVIAAPGVRMLDERWYDVGGFVIAAAAAPTPDTQRTATLSLEGYRLSFSEEFDGQLDVSAWGPGTRWIAHTPWAGDFGDAAFGDPAAGHPFSIENGVLRIEARKAPAFAQVDPYKRLWRSGLLASNDPRGNGFSQQYGYFECRAKMPRGPGVWGAFWLMSSFDRTQPKSGEDGSVEIDVVELYGHESAEYKSVVHVWKPDPHRAENTTITTMVDEVSDDLHRYGVMVEPDFVTMYFDGVEVWKTKTPAEHNKPLMLLVNLALGAGWPIDKTPNPSNMYVDYIRVYAMGATD